MADFYKLFSFKRIYIYSILYEYMNCSTVHSIGSVY